MPDASSAHVAPAPPDIDLRRALDRTRNRMRADGYRGYDPYDALTSPVFAVPLIRSSKVLRLSAQQALKRLPLNVRPLLGIEKGYNPVTLALAAHGYAHLASVEPHRGDELGRDAAALVFELKRLARPTESGIGWGYDFPWQTRYELFPANTPTVVATAIVADGLVAVHEAFENDEALDLCTRAAAFLAQDLPRIPGEGDSFCWAYSQLDRQPVLNATAKGARLLAQVATLTDAPELVDLARATLRYVAEHQRGDGAWPYSIGDARSWTDNFHTGYILDSLHEYQERTGDRSFQEATARGWEYYRRNFFESDIVPRYYDTQTFPVDATAVAQSLITLTRFGDVQSARRVASWAIEHLQHDDGSFSYQKRRRLTIRIPYMRWSTAWMFCGLAHVAAG